MAIIFCTILLSQAAQVLADNGNVSKEIDRIETTENSKTIYYADGSKEMFVSAIVGFEIETSTEVSRVISVPPPYSFPFEKILDVLREIIETVVNPVGIGCNLLVWKIRNLIKELRNNRPKDYNRVYWK